MTYHLVFDATDPKSPRFIELENSTGQSISAGEWKQRKDGYVELVLPAPLSKDCTQTSVTPATDEQVEDSAISIGARWASEPVWQDIATAPRDGTHFLSYNGVRSCVARSGRFGFFSVPGNYQIKPIYWMPLPSPPKPLSYEGEQS